MALVKASLQSDLESWMQDGIDGAYSSTLDSMFAFANKYYDYAFNGVDVSGDVRSDASALLVTLILQALNAPADSTDFPAQIFASAIKAYWEGGQFQLFTPPPGAIIETSAMVTTNLNETTLKNNLKNIFDNPSPTVAAAAQQWADALHNATITVITTCMGNGPPPPSLPVTAVGPVS